MGRSRRRCWAFTNADGDGAYGLEKSYDDVLSGTDGRTITIRNARGNAIADSSAVTYDAKDGNSLVLTLDSTIQEVVEKIPGGGGGGQHGGEPGLRHRHGT